MIWIEILSRHRDVAARFRIIGTQARIGRGYDNDVIVDDPYVAAEHLRVFRDEDGNLVAEDLGSANGTFVDGNKGRVSRFIVDGRHPIRIGHTYLRIRDISHAVERERLAPPERRILPVVLAILIGASIVAFEALKIWLMQTGEARISSYLTPLLTLTAMLFAWVGLWALLARVFSGRSRFARNMLIALIGTVGFVLYNEFAEMAAFAWTWPVAATYQYVAVWLIFALTCFLHLREVGQRRSWLKGAVVAGLLVVGISAQTLQQSEALSDSGRQTAVHRLKPPGFRMVPLRDRSAFFERIGDLKARLDGDRT